MLRFELYPLYVYICKGYIKLVPMGSFILLFQECHVTRNVLKLQMKPLLQCIVLLVFQGI
jgi:hypothetical protein